MLPISSKRLSFILGILVFFFTAFQGVNCYGDSNNDVVPYCINVTFAGDVQSCRGITWLTNERTASDLLLVETDKNGTDNFSNAKKYQGTSWSMDRYIGHDNQKVTVNIHQIVLTGLRADTTYAYKIGDISRNAMSEAGTFRTAAREGAFSFIITADSQGDDEKSSALSAQAIQMAFNKVPEADFLIHMGDFVQNYSSGESHENLAEWQWFFAAARQQLMHTTIMPVAGNHDQTKDVFCSQFALGRLIPANIPTATGSYYWADYGNTSFIVLNTNEGYQAGDGRISEEQISWLKNMSAQADRRGATWKILLLHRGIYSFGRHMDSEDIINLRQQLAPLISDLKIDLVLQGHDHVYMRSKVLAKSASGQVAPTDDRLKPVSQDYNGEKIDFTVNPPGTTYITPNLIGTQFGFCKKSDTVQVYPEAQYKPDDNDEPVFASISIDGNRLVYKAYAYAREGDGQVKEIDRYAILKDKNAVLFKSVPPDRQVYGCLPAAYILESQGLFLY